MKAGVFQRLRATERRMLRMICGVMSKDKVESTAIASRVGVDNLEEHLRQKQFRWRKRSVGVENRRMRKERQASEMME